MLDIATCYTPIFIKTSIGGLSTMYMKQMVQVTLFKVAEYGNEKLEP